MRKAYIIIFVIIVISYAVGIYLYPQMPAEMASHWNAKGEVDGYMSKYWGLFLMPMVASIMLLLFMIIPKIDPLKKNIEKFRKFFDMFIVLIVLFLMYIHAISILWSMGIQPDMNLMIAPAMVILFYYVGVLVENAKRNWFIGIRTPWTLSSDKVWEKTHRIGGKLFKLCALFALVGMIFRDYLMWFVLIPVLSISVYLIVFSYFEWNKEEK